MQATGNLATENRLDALREVLKTENSVQIAQAAEQLGVSEMTIRRDLQELEALGFARRVRGGAVAVGPVAFVERHKHRARAKSAIATKLLPLLPHSGAVAMDASSTVLRLATAVGSARDLSVLTNSLDTFKALNGKSGVLPLLTGGQLDPRTGSLVGPLACRSSSQLLVSQFFTSAAAVSAELGTSETCIEEAEVKRSLQAVANEVVLAVDSSKLNQRAVAVCFAWPQVTILVTELDPAHPRLEAYRDLVEIR